MKPTLIVGNNGQDGTLLSRLLQERGVNFMGLGRDGLVDANGRLLQPGKLTDPAFIGDLIRSIQPSRVYYLAAHHHSSQDAALSKNTDLWSPSFHVQVLGLVHLLDALRLHSSDVRLLYAASSHIFGAPEEEPQTELTPFHPVNIYGVTKVMGIEACRYHQRQYGLFASVGILYNHESVLRPENFLSQKIIRGALAIKAKCSTLLVLGDLSSEVDWGYAPDYVEAMVRILDLEQPGDYVIATGKRHTVREFVQLVFAQLDLDYREWVGEDPSIIRKSKNRLVGDSSKLRRETGWSPSVSFPEMVRLLVAQTQALYPS